jgi:hypothetical protein
MTNFEEKLKDLLIERGIVEDLWTKSVNEAQEENDEDLDLLDEAVNIFHDVVIEYVYDWIAENIQDETVKELLAEATNDADFDDIVNAIIIEQHLMEV